ncbi:PREDICTED: maestro heat-like repeat-containing protein family member 7 [Tauraco erythrolophus]|uniref:maestro heat-like repeat-containing protein family member 7 n=1 Tax=Tauraco erythrolophus TaxID=121530 RepID=UPI0005238353|nr:PREDICTED: maestro heat-like repeat-containing protein family member 7 [Tauraco erythrolophus]
MWEPWLSQPQAVERVLRGLLDMLMDPLMRQTSTFTQDDACILSLASTRMITKILVQPTHPQVVEAIFPRLFLALLLQVPFARELILQEVHIFWQEDEQDPLTPLRSLVYSMRLLLCSMGFEEQVLAIEVQGGWDALLRTETHLLGVCIMAREMTKTPKHLCSTIFFCLAELLSVEDPIQEMVTMAFLIEMLGCTNLNEEQDHALEIFATYLKSQHPEMPRLVLRGILTLTERPDIAKKSLVLLPIVMEQPEDGDGDASDMVLPMLANMLWLQEVTESSRTALALADKLRWLFDNESGTDESMAKASQEALCSAGRFLKWRQLVQLVENAQAWKIGECLLARKKSRAKDYLHQSQHYLQNPQELLWQEAVRFLGLLGWQVLHCEMKYIEKPSKAPAKIPAPQSPPWRFRHSTSSKQEEEEESPTRGLTCNGFARSCRRHGGGGTQPPARPLLSGCWCLWG